MLNLSRITQSPSTIPLEKLGNRIDKKRAEAMKAELRYRSLLAKNKLHPDLTNREAEAIKVCHELIQLLDESAQSVRNEILQIKKLASSVNVGRAQLKAKDAEIVKLNTEIEAARTEQKNLRSSAESTKPTAETHSRSMRFLASLGHGVLINE